MNTIKLKPGLLVRLRTTIDGGATYEREDLAKVVGSDHSEVARWTTTRRVENVEEYDAAKKQRVAARKLVAMTCLATPWGLVCPEENEEEMHAALGAARQLAEEFNASATSCRLSVSAMIGRIARDDQEAIIALQEEITLLLTEAQQAVYAGDVVGIRKAATQARQIGRLLDDEESSGVLDAAVANLRKTARDITRLVEKKGEELETVVTNESLRPVAAARYAFQRIGNSTTTTEGGAA